MSPQILRPPTPPEKTDSQFSGHRPQRRRAGVLIAVLVAAILLVALALPATANAFTPQPMLKGQVTAAGSLMPLAGVKVQVMSGTTVIAQTFTGWNGFYHVSVAAGTYDVQFSRKGYETLTDTAVIVTGPMTTLNAQLTAAP